jgi:glutamine synthetase type III
MGMKEWALSKGSITHTWFQPLTGQLLKTRCFETSYDGSDPVEKFEERN